MSRAEQPLESRVQALEETVERLDRRLQEATNRDIPLLKGTIRAMADESIDDVDAFPQAGRRFSEDVRTMGKRLEELEERMARFGKIGDERSSKDEKYAAVLSFAAHKRTSNGKVAVSPAEIKGCTGVSRRYAYDLVEAMADDLDGVGVREAGPVETGAGVKRRSKALLVDCEAVQASNGGVKEFTTTERDGRES